jgi:hypothetical protein
MTIIQNGLMSVNFVILLLYCFVIHFHIHNLSLFLLFQENSTAIVQEEISKVRQKLSKIFPDISVDVDDEVRAQSLSVVNW